MVDEREYADEEEGCLLQYETWVVLGRVAQLIRAHDFDDISVGEFMAFADSSVASGIDGMQVSLADIGMHGECKIWWC